VIEELRAELLRRAEQDLAARREPEADWELVTSVDAANLGWLKNLVAEVGWPGRSMVGEDGAHAAWLLAEHSEHDPVFRRKCRECLTEAAERDEASRAELARGFQGDKAAHWGCSISGRGRGPGLRVLAGASETYVAPVPGRLGSRRVSYGAKVPISTL
jgi:hypothetical protein